MTAQELRDWAAIAPIGTFIVAAFAATIAIMSLRTQVRVARSRAAIDFFLKTEMDKETLTAYDRYRAGMEWLSVTDAVDEHTNSLQYRAICAYLDIIELMAIGVNHGVFSQRVCYGFWKLILSEACHDAIRVIRCVQSRPGAIQMYAHLLRLNRRWNGRHWPWQWFWRRD